MSKEYPDYYFCEICGAPLVDLEMIDRGKVVIVSVDTRCKNCRENIKAEYLKRAGI